MHNIKIYQMIITKLPKKYFICGILIVFMTKIYT